MSSKHGHSAALKAQLVLEVLLGQKTLESACRRAGVSEQQLLAWQAEFMSYSARVFSTEEDLAAAEARIAELERLVGRLMLQLELGRRAPVANKHSMSNGQRH